MKIVSVMGADGDLRFTFVAADGSRLILVRIPAGEPSHKSLIDRSGSGSSCNEGAAHRQWFFRRAHDEGRPDRSVAGRTPLLQSALRLWNLLREKRPAGLPC